MSNQSNTSGGAARVPAERAAAKRVPPSGLPVLPPRNAFIELAVFFVPLMLLDAYLPGFPELSQVQPHPYWLPVLLLSLQYGTVSGLLAASAAITASALAGFPEQEVGENHFSYLVRIWLQPMLWIGAALILGQFRMRQIAERAELRLRNDELFSQRAALAEYAENLQARCERLERGMAGRGSRDAAGLLDALARLQQPSPSGTAGLLDGVVAAFPEAQASLFRVQAEGLVLEASRGWPADSGLARTFGRDSPLYRAIVDAATALDVLDATDDATLAGQGLAAVPIMAAAGDRVHGMLKLERVAPEVLTTSLTARLSVIARHLGAALDASDGQLGRARPAAEPALAAGRSSGWRHQSWRSRRAERPQGNGAKSSRVV